MGTDINLAAVNKAYAWANARAGGLTEGVQLALNIIENSDANSGQDYYDALGAIGHLYDALGDMGNASKYYELYFEKAAALLEQGVDSEQNVLEMSFACLSLGSFFSKVSNIEGACGLFTTMYGVVVGFLSAHPGNMAVLKMKMAACENLADLLIRQELPSSAWPCCVEFNNTVLQILSEVPDDIETRSKISSSHILFGDYYLKTNAYETALECYLQAEMNVDDMMHRYKAYADFRATYALVHEKLGTLYTNKKNYEQAIAHYTKNLDTLEELSRAYPENVLFELNKTISVQCIATVFYRQKDLEKASQYFERCFVMTTALIHQITGYAELKRMLVIVYQYKAFICVDLGQLEDAKTNYLMMYNYLYDLTKLYPDNPLYKENLGYTSMLYAFFLKQEMNDAGFVKYFKEAYKLYTELCEKYPGFPEYVEKAELCAEVLAELASESKI